MDGIPTLDFWDYAMRVLHSLPNQLNNSKDQVRGKSTRDTTSNKHSINQTKVPTKHDNFDPSHGDHVSSNFSILCDVVHF